GFLGAFLGIGGGPFNVAALTYFFSMDMKTAAQNSLYIIVFSQATGIAELLAAGAVPTVSGGLLLGSDRRWTLGSDAGLTLIPQ
ncbi:MAG: sulfite exporter TauE/SafE family protein, partial [Lachnospiraceae bacterium]|nr:sulfite exporter TauE/SafE family protein [Lachnospiraceae bacterium]